MERYSRQEAFFGIGPGRQQKLLASRVTVIGLGALGSASANLLARAGVGYLRLVDRDYVELSNLQRQMLYTEHDALEAVPKAAAAAEHLAQINSEIEIEPVIVDVNSGTIDALIEDVDLIVDATDNFEVRMLVNEACHVLKKPWIYGGAVASYGMTMNILPEKDAPCLRCLISEDHPEGETCATAGVLGTLTSIVASIQCTEALKILTGSPDVRRTLLAFDIWSNEIDEVQIDRDPDCPVCSRGEYLYYGKASGTQSASLCGRDAVQIVPAGAARGDSAVGSAAGQRRGDSAAGSKAGSAAGVAADSKAGQARVDFDLMEERWAGCGEVKRGRYTLDLDTGTHRIKLFPDGRAIISGTTDEAKAKSIYSEYIGL